MTSLTSGNIIEADAEALVNTVNCIGHMGKGIALQFKKAFPENFKAYAQACRAGSVLPGNVFIYKTMTFVGPKYIMNFPTKRHWRGKSRIEDIKAGLTSLIEEVEKLGIHSIAVPPLGCGLGGLNWGTVRPLIEQAFQSLPEVEVQLFKPLGSPDAKAMPVNTQKPSLTRARALLIKLIQQYSKFAYRLTLLEIHKLAYFLQEAGEPLRLRHKAGLYGPYAHNLNKVLELMEGHFIRGYGDNQKPDSEIELVPGAVEEADVFLGKHNGSQKRLAEVGRLIDGFETPYGMELLSSVHWVSVHAETPATNTEEVVQAVHGWNDRKRNMFRPEHIHVAWERLAEKNWLQAGEIEAGSS